MTTGSAARGAAGMGATTRGLLALLAVTTSVPALAAPPGTIEGTIDGLGKGPVLVYVEEIRGATYPPADPAPLMNQRRNTYVPRVLPVVVGSKVELRSEDPELHNVYAWALSLNRTLFNIAIPPKTPPQYRTFDDVGVVKLTCNIHKEMLAYVVVLQNPHYVLVDKGGSKFRLAGVPPGKHVVRIWGEKLDEAALGKRFPVEVKSGDTARLTINGGDKS